MKLILENTSFSVRAYFKESKNISKYYQKNKFVGSYQVIGSRDRQQKQWVEAMVSAFLKKKHVIVKLKLNFNFINYNIKWWLKPL